MMNRKTTKSDDILILYVSFVDSNGGKKRPVLVVETSDDAFTFFSLTTKYDKKSDKIKKQYYKIKKWKKAGLLKQTYVDIGKVREISFKSKIDFYKIGELSTDNIIGLSEFIEKFYQ